MNLALVLVFSLCLGMAHSYYVRHGVPKSSGVVRHGGGGGHGGGRCGAGATEAEAAAGTTEAEVAGAMAAAAATVGDTTATAGHITEAAGTKHYGYDDDDSPDARPNVCPCSGTYNGYYAHSCCSSSLYLYRHGGYDYYRKG